MQSDKIIEKYKEMFDALENYDKTRTFPFQRKRIDLTLSVRTIDKLKRLREETGKPISRIIEGCIRKMPIRKSAVAGKFYPAEPEELRKEVEEYLENKKESISMAISPHAGYVFSGKLAGDVIGRFPEKRNFIILGVNHAGLGSKISISQQDFETPLGLVKNNQDLGGKILKKLKEFDAKIDELPGKLEHSIEVQLPFLQLSQKRFEIVTILLKNLSYEECQKVALQLSEFIDENIALLVSSDFTHYGSSYGFLPFTKDVKKNLYALDNEIIVNILNLNSKKVFELASKSTVCGVYGITIATELAKIKKMKAKLVEYYTSGDITGDFSNCVGYSGITFG